MTNTTGTVVWNAEYTPFGSITMEEGIFEKSVKFTGKDLDEDTGLYYYNARWYDAEIGRFTSADTYKGELENPQTLNVYIYTSNNPLIYVDPSGNIPVETIWDVASLGVGFVSLGSSIKDGDWLGAGLDTLGIIGDGLSAVVPYLPGGYSNAIRGARLAKNAKRLTDAADVAGGIKEVYHGVEEGNALQVGLGGLQAGLGLKGVLSDGAKGIAKASSEMDELSGLNKGTGKVISYEDYIDIYNRSIHNGFSNEIILGKYDGGGSTSYITKAKDYGMSYFDLGADWDNVKLNQNLTDHDMFKLFNESFLDDAVNSGKKINFSHDPRLYPDSTLEMEWEYLKNNYGFSKLFEKGDIINAKYIYRGCNLSGNYN